MLGLTTVNHICVNSYWYTQNIYISIILCRYRYLSFIYVSYIHTNIYIYIYITPHSGGYTYAWYSHIFSSLIPTILSDVLPHCRFPHRFPRTAMIFLPFRLLRPSTDCHMDDLLDLKMGTSEDGKPNSCCFWGEFVPPKKGNLSA